MEIIYIYYVIIYTYYVIIYGKCWTVTYYLCSEL